jgi:hypothetical protein
MKAKFRLNDILDDLDAAEKRGATREQPDGAERVADEREGHPVELFVAVRCVDEGDRSALADRLRAEGRSVAFRSSAA